ncbi:MAG: cupin domain-containing protein [Dehalococcoidia bacterium]|nr:cupin domain-containing protein [Dehalococcoidia bacterium]
MKHHLVREDSAGRITVEAGALSVTPMAAPCRDATSVPLASAGQPASSALLVTVGPGGHILEHAAPVEGLVFVLAGSGQLGLPGQEPVRFQAGDVLSVGANATHDWDAFDDGFTLGVVLMA